MPFVPPIPLIRKKAIERGLTRERAYTKESAKYLDEIGLVNPYGFHRVTKMLVDKGVISKTDEGKYYLNR